MRWYLSKGKARAMLMSRCAMQLTRASWRGQECWLQPRNRCRGPVSIEHGDEPDRETLEIMKKKGTFLVFTAGIVFALSETGTNEDQRAYFKGQIEVLRRTVSLA